MILDDNLAMFRHFYLRQIDQFILIFILIQEVLVVD